MTFRSDYLQRSEQSTQRLATVHNVTKTASATSPTRETGRSPDVRRHNDDEDSPSGLETTAARFQGVLRKRLKSFIITGIDLQSNEQGLHEFLIDLEVPFKSAYFIYTRRTDCQVAKVTVSEDAADILEDTELWPPGMSCRPWMKHADYKAKRDRNLDNNDNCSVD